MRRPQNLKNLPFKFLKFDVYSGVSNCRVRFFVTFSHFFNLWMFIFKTSLCIKRHIQFIYSENLLRIVKEFCGLHGIHTVKFDDINQICTVFGLCSRFKRNLFGQQISRSKFEYPNWNFNRKRNQFILYYKRGVNPRGWIYTPIHFRNVQHRKRYFYLRSGIFIQLWTTTRLRTIVLPFTFANMYAEAWLQRCHDFLCPVQNCLQYRG